MASSSSQREVRRHVLADGKLAQEARAARPFAARHTGVEGTDLLGPLSQNAARVPTTMDLEDLDIFQEEDWVHDPFCAVQDPPQTLAPPCAPSPSGPVCLRDQAVFHQDAPPVPAHQQGISLGKAVGPSHAPQERCGSTVSGPTVVPSIEDQARIHARAQAWRAQAWRCRPRGALPAVHPPDYRILQWRAEERERISDECVCWVSTLEQAILDTEGLGGADRRA
eukprot:428975-Pyramimonas_sp.AAC.1